MSRNATGKGGKRAGIRAISPTWTRDCSWLKSGCRNINWRKRDSETNQRLLCPRLCRGLSPSQHLGWRCWIWWWTVFKADRPQNSGRRALQFTSVMLGGQRGRVDEKCFPDVKLLISRRWPFYHYFFAAFYVSPNAYYMYIFVQCSTYVQQEQCRKSLVAPCIKQQLIIFMIT